MKSQKTTQKPQAKTPIHSKGLLRNSSIMSNMTFNFQKVLSIFILLFALSYLTYQIATNKEQLNDIVSSVMDYRSISHNIVNQPTPTRYPTNAVISPTSFPTAIPTQVVYDPQPENPADQVEWGVAKEIGEGTYSIRVGSDEAMATAQEVLQSLNNYRSVNGRSQLTWDDNLGSYAQSRADHFSSIQSTDQHAGFNSYLENEDGFNSLGFYSLGENSYYGGKLTGTHLIEWVFAKSPGHDANQKDGQWSHVGIGVTDTSANLIFGGQKM